VLRLWGRGDSVRAARFLWTVARHVSLLLTEETSSFCHEPSFLFVAEGSGVDGVYIHRIWVTRGRAPSLSALSKASLPLVSGPQVSLVAVLWAEGEDGLFSEVLSQFVAHRLLPLGHGLGPDIPVVESSGSESQPERVDGSFIRQLPSRFCGERVERRDIIIYEFVFHFEMLQFLISIFLLCCVGESVRKGRFEVCPQCFIALRCRSYFKFKIVELFINPVIDLWSSNERQGCGHPCVWLFHDIGKWVHDFVDLEVAHEGL
jgi:hypothetical protein